MEGQWRAEDGGDGENDGSVEALVRALLSECVPDVVGSPDYDLAVRILRAYTPMPLEEVAARHRDYRIAHFEPDMLHRAKEVLWPALKPLQDVFPQYVWGGGYAVRRRV